MPNSGPGSGRVLCKPALSGISGTLMEQSWCSTGRLLLGHYQSTPVPLTPVYQ